MWRTLSAEVDDSRVLRLCSLLNDTVLDNGTAADWQVDAVASGTVRTFGNP
ncbi:hypothetical protein [Muricoccus nepalensis]|uniref:hypothetical protein n=1 Tax=Muricoccus nepalensis TaxID=1854500 RepID=UPI001386BFF9|nr:hypothetical protein [Roseomonas nepalensis]